MTMTYYDNSKSCLRFQLFKFTQKISDSSKKYNVSSVILLSNINLWYLTVLEKLFLVVFHV